MIPLPAYTKHSDKRKENETQTELTMTSLLSDRPGRPFLSLSLRYHVSIFVLQVFSLAFSLLDKKKTRLKDTVMLYHFE